MQRSIDPAGARSGAKNTPQMMAANSRPQAGGSVAARRAAMGRLRRVLRLVLAASVALLFVAFASGGRVDAAPGLQRIHGVVLAVTPQSGEAIVRYDAFGSVPSMTKPFRIVPRERAAQLQAGSMIDAEVNTKTTPWTLSRVTSASALPITEDQARHVKPLSLGETVPDTAFVDQTGKPFRFSQLRGQDVVLTFIYTRCQDARECPLLSAKFRRLQMQGARRKLHLVEVTIDPTYDRPPVLARYGRTFGADPSRWSIVVGDADPTLNFAAQFGVVALRDPNGDFIHSENTVLVDRDGRVRKMIAESSWLPAEILAQVDLYDGIASNPLARLNLWLSEKAVATFGNSVAGFSGLTDLAVALTIVCALAYLIYRLSRFRFSK